VNPAKDALTFEFPPLQLPSEQKRRRVGDLHSPIKVIGLTQLSNLVQKCDAKRPCETCIQDKRASECIYEDERRPHPPSVRLIHGTGGRLPGRQLGSAEPVEISTPAPTDGVFTDMILPAKLKLMCSAPDSIRLVTDESSALQQVPHSHSSGLSLVRRNPPERVSPDTSPPINIRIPFLPPIILSEPFIPLSFLGAEKLQVQISDADATDMDMGSCVLEYESIGHKLILQH
jgi:hypothetical protein